MDPHRPVDLARILLIIIALSGLMLGSVYVMRPFVPGMIWASTIVVSTWPMLIRIQRRCRNRRLIATSIMLALLLVVLILPIYAAVATLVLHTSEIMAVIRDLPTYTLPPPPEWLSARPLAGRRIGHEWQLLSDAGPGGLLAKLQPYVTLAARWILAHFSALGVFVLHMTVTFFVSAILYMKGDEAARYLLRFASRVAGERGAESVRLAGLAIRGVALGIVVTAVIQAALGGLGLWLAAVPAAGLLTALILILCLTQIGPFLPLLGGAAWMFYTGAHVVGVILAIWSVVVSMLSTFVRPMLIRRGVKLSMLLMLAGVLGGMFAFGIVGLFIGPVLLAVTSTLLDAWIAEPQLTARSGGTEAVTVPVKPD